MDRDGKRLQCSWCEAEGHFVPDCPPGAAKKHVRSRLEKRVPAVHTCHELVAGIDHLIANFDNDEYRNHGQTHGQAAKDYDSPSELHIFDSFDPSSETAQVTSNEDIPSTIFFDEVDKSVALGCIATHFAGLAAPPTPQKIGISEDQDFHEGV